MARPDSKPSFEEFPSKKGALEIAFHIGTGGARFTELQEKTGLSPSTLSKRLKLGEGLGLWTTVADRDREGGKSKQKYVPKEPGLILFNLMADVSYAHTYVEYSQSREKLEKKREEMSERIEEAVEEGELQRQWEELPEPSSQAVATITSLYSMFDIEDGFNIGTESETESELATQRSGTELSESDIDWIEQLLLANDLGEEVDQEVIDQLDKSETGE